MTQDEEEIQFWTQMLARPDDQTVRLVFADWLQDRDDPRAEAVRIIVKVGAAPDPSGIGNYEGRERRHPVWRYEDYGHRGYKTCFMHGEGTFPLDDVRRAMIPSVWYDRLETNKPSEGVYFVGTVPQQVSMKTFLSFNDFEAEMVRAWTLMTETERDTIRTMIRSLK